MTRKTRRSKSGEDDAGSEADSCKETAPALQPATDGASSPAPVPPAVEPARKVTLPAYGFAADLLPRSSDRPEVGAESPAPGIDAADPRRIFAFADSLEHRAAAPEAARVRLETWVAFSLAGEVFALPVSPVREVVRVATITRVPHAPKPIRGVTNRRGRVIPVVDLRLRIELPAGELGRASRVIVVSSRGRLLGLLVDAVHQVIHIDLAKIQPPPDDVMTVQSDYLSGVYHLDDQLILLLDLDRALIIQEPVAEVTAGATSESAPDSADSPAELKSQREESSATR